MKQLGTGRHVRVTGCFMAWHAKGPIMILIEGTPWLAIFSTRERLDEAMRIMLEPEQRYRVESIKDGGVAFLKELQERGLRIALNPRLHEGNTQYSRLKIQ